MVIRHLFLWVAVAFVCILLIGTTVSAEELSLSQAVELALKNNPAIAAQQFSADAAAQLSRGARALANPEISVSPNISGSAGADSAVFFLQPLEINGSRKLRGRIAAHQEAAAGFNAVTARRDVLLRVKQFYWDIARAQELVRLNQDNILHLETLGAAVQKQYDVGTVPGSQLIKTEVEMAKARQELAMALLELSLAKATLNSLMNRPNDVGFTVSDPLKFSDVAIDKATLQASALANRPEIASALAQTSAAKMQIKATQLRRMPDIAVQARTDTFESDSAGGVALAMTLPVLDWGSVKSDTRQAEMAARSQEKLSESVSSNVALDVEQSIQMVATSSLIVREYQGGILDKSEELAQMAQTGYEKGATSYLEVLEAQRTLRSTRTAYYSALADHTKAIAQLEWAAGRSLLEITTEVKK